MPTPESEAFKAKKPTVPPTFDGVDFRNNQQVWDARDAIIREQWVKQMMARLVRDELGKVTFSFDGVMCESYRFGAGGVCSVVSWPASTGDEWKIDSLTTREHDRKRRKYPCVPAFFRGGCCCQVQEFLLI
jgi:hypothetical protein